MAAMRFGLVTSAVRICPSTIRRRAAAASNMRETPDCRTGLCDTPRQNASESRFLFRNRGQAPLSPLTAVPLIYVRKALPKQIGAGYPCRHGHVAEWLRSGLQIRKYEFSLVWCCGLVSKYRQLTPRLAILVRSRLVSFWAVG